MTPAATALLAVTLSATVAGIASGATPERRSYYTRRAAVAPVIDGRVDDPAWDGVEWSGDFVQRQPANGEPPTRQTEFKIVYDDRALYVAVRAHDDPGLASSLLSRHDRFPGDWIEINIDSYFDHRTAFSFTLSLSGTRGDEYISEDGQRWDTSWDPIWEGATASDPGGWTGEMRIPLSQLRFSSAPEQVWGIQLTRRLFREEERSSWQPLPKDADGWVSRFGELRGIQDVRPRRRVELLPYAVGSAERFPGDADDPFRDGADSSLTGGLDGKLGVTSDLTLDFTINPDFGQVEADPSEVNLTAFETFFPERRPFFVEGKDIFELPLAPAITGGPFTSDTLFYSRRIGRAPSRSPELDDGDYALEPTNSSILGAAKLSGKTSSGLTIGVLDALTARERAEIGGAGGGRRFEPVEPRTNYFVGRLRQDLRGGQTQLGLMLTSVLRDVDAPPLDFLPSRAHAGGIDVSHYFRERDYRLEASLLASELSGSAGALEEVQTSSARYFQRPDASHVTLDPTRTDMGGHAGSVRLTRTNNSALRFQTGVAWRSPGFEINDIGFMRSADEINQFTWVGYVVREPFSVFRQLSVNANQWLDWDFGGTLLRQAFNTNAHAWFRNNYQVGGSVTRFTESVSNAELRGGPSSRWPGAWEYNGYAQSDWRRRLSVGVSLYGRVGDSGSGRFTDSSLDVTLRPTNAMTLTLSPSVSRNRQEMQYVDTASFGEEPRYLFGGLEQKTVSLTFRLDLALKPNLTVQLYGSPFASSGRYSEHKRITAPLAEGYRDRFAAFTPEQVGREGDDYRVDEDGDGVVDYSFGDPDFDSREFNSTLVVRWEYQPGSLLYVVWSQARSDGLLRSEDLAFGRGLRDVFDVPPHDVFLIKLSKWFSL